MQSVKDCESKVSGNSRDVGVLCQWYTYTKENLLISVPMDGFNINQYVLIIPQPLLDNGNLVLSNDVLKQIKKYF